MSSEEMTREERRSPRLIARIPLDVQPLESLAATTAVINLHGALILSPTVRLRPVSPPKNLGSKFRPLDF
jgi:hypothetical protein